MSKVEVFYRGVPVPEMYINNLGTVEFTHFTRGVDAALADEVYPPAPKFEYYKVANTGLAYRIGDGRVEFWEGSPGRPTGWTRSHYAKDLAGLIRVWGVMVEISAGDLPKAAR